MSFIFAFFLLVRDFYTVAPERINLIIILIMYNSLFCIYSWNPQKMYGFHKVYGVFLEKYLDFLNYVKSMLKSKEN